MSGDKFGADHPEPTPPAEQGALEDDGPRALEYDAPPEWVGLLLDGLVTALRPTPDRGTGAPGEAGDTPAPLFATVQAWVMEWLAPTIVRRDSAEFRWCPQWWEHPEPLSRLTGLWVTWEQARLGQAVDLNVWWLLQLDPHLAAITRPDGPFGGCSQAKGHLELRPGLAVQQPPPGAFGAAP